MSVVAHRGGPSLSQELSVCRVDEVIIGEAAAMVGQQAGRGDDARRGIGSKTISMHRRQLGFGAVAVVVFEGERAGVECQRVELQ